MDANQRVVKVLQLIFGLTYTNLSVNLRFGICLLVETFHDNPLAQVSLPLSEEINEYKSTFGEWHQLLHDCWATMDGLKLYLQQTRNTEIQEQFYNGWTHDHHVTSVFCVCPDETIPIVFFNVSTATATPPPPHCAMASRASFMAGCRVTSLSALRH